MGAFRNNQRPAPNPRISGDAVPGFWGLSAIGGMTCQQAAEGGYATIWTQVIDWPFAEDDAGVAFDQANLYGVRTRCLRQALVDGGGDSDDWWVAVPKTLPAEYTATGRCHGQILPLFDDHLGDNPLHGRVSTISGPEETWPVRWRTPNGVYPPESDADGYLWVPMNLSQQTFLSELNGGGYGFWVTDGSVTLSTAAGTNPVTGIPFGALSTSFPLDYYGASLGRHVGFRGGVLTFSYRGGGYSDAFQYPWSGYTRVKIGYSTDPVFAPDFPATIVWDSDWYKTEADYVGFIDGYLTYTQKVLAIPAMLPTPSQKPPYWYIFWATANQGVSPPGLVDTGISGVAPGNFNLSPRTDVPLWYFASTRNKVAPGGIIP